MWHGLNIAQVVLEGLVRDEEALRLEGAVSGLDALDEIRLHRLIAKALETTGFGVLREVPFPSLTPAQKRDPQRLRCDVVLTPSPGQRIRDELRALRDKKAHEESLFKSSESDGVDPRECLWIEVKCVGQFTYTSGVPQPNRAYSSELIGAVYRDAMKLATDTLVVRAGRLAVEVVRACRACERGHAAGLVLLFSESREVAEHDLGVAANRALDRGAPINAFHFEHLPIADRIGNRVLTIAAFEIDRP